MMTRQTPFDLNAFCSTLTEAFTPLSEAFNNLGAALVHAFGACDVFFEELARLDALRIAEEERTRRALMEQVTWWTWRVVAGLVVGGVLTLWRLI